MLRAIYLTTAIAIPSNFLSPMEGMIVAITLGSDASSLLAAASAAWTGLNSMVISRPGPVRLLASHMVHVDCFFVKIGWSIHKLSFILVIEIITIIYEYNLASAKGVCGDRGQEERYQGS
jgi:hypothetical protein